MLSASAQFDFAAEFVGLLVAAAGLVLVALRADVTRRSSAARLALCAGFVLLGAAAFAHGAQILVTGAAVTLGAGRALGAALLLAGAVAWSGRRSRAILAVGAAVTLAGAAAEAGGVGATPVAAVLLAGSAVVGLALTGAARRSIAVRVAVNAAVTLLLVVLVLSIALSTVITSSVEHEQLVQFRTRAAVEAGAVAVTANDGLEAARLVAADLDAVAAADRGRLTVAAAGRRLATVASFYPVGAVAFLPAAGGVVGSSPVLGARVRLLSVATTSSCVPAAPGSAGGRDVVDSDGRAAAVAAFPVCAGAPPSRLGAVVVSVPLDDAYLAGLRRVDPAVSLGLVGASGVLARAGTAAVAPATGPTAPAASAAGATARLSGDRFVAVVPVRPLSGPVASAAPVFSFVVSLPATSIAATRDSLLRTLFVIALGGTLLALVLASVIGDRITAGLRRLTTMAQDVGAQSIGDGRISQRAGVVSRDEVGALAGAFDAMVESVEDKNAALRTAADDETRLRNRLEAVIAGMSDALVAVDSAGTVTAFNRAAEQLVGRPAALALGRPVSETVVLAPDDEGVDPAGRIARLDPAGWTALSHLPDRGAGPLPVAVSSGAVRGPAGEVVGIVLVLRDLRRERELERMKSEFLSRVGHELRTPLTGILGYADILVRRDVPPAQARLWHGEILDAAKRQLRIVQLLEFFASAGAGRLLLRPRPTPAAALVDDALAGWAERLPEGFRLTTRVDPGLPEVSADRRWMTLAIGELVDNAVKFSAPGGQVAVRATLEPGDPDGGDDTGPTVAITVADRGRGMTLEEQARAFGDFEQGDASDTRSFGGLGLGLSAVLRVVAGHGGRVDCRSAPGRGTTMTVHLPVVATPVAGAVGAPGG